MGFATICVGITILQMSKVDPTELKTLDRRSTILLQAARHNTEAMDEKSVIGMEDPGIDTLRGSFGTMGSIIRARSARRMSQNSRLSGSRFGSGGRSSDAEALSSPIQDQYSGMKRHQLWDAPVPRSNSFQLAGRAGSDPDLERMSTTSSTPRDRKQTIKFGDQDVVHQYRPTGQGGNTIDDAATHEHRLAHHGLSSPPLPPLPDSAARDRSISSLIEGGSPNASGSNVALYAPSDADPPLRTAPANLGPGAPYGQYSDPFSSTASNLSSYPSSSMDDDERERAHSHRRLFERGSTSSSRRDSSRGVKNYPKIRGSEEEEERQRLVGVKSDDEDEFTGGVSPADTLDSQATIGGQEAMSPEIQHMGIRLVDRGTGSRF